MNPVYVAYMGNPNNRPAVNRPSNPMQMYNQAMQAMHNPLMTIMQAFPDIPSYMQNDPGQIMQYLQQTRHISNEQVQNLISQIPRF